ncbi:MAG: hypothetical protein C0453_00155 [Comamonadaceae bacterium]|nr:hypothetical protein [Comamonadaceae bacterium]
MPAFDRLQLLWDRLLQTLWWRPAVWSAGAVAVAVASSLVDQWIPDSWLPGLSDGVVKELLHLMASSMLVVSTFALSVLASAYAAAANAGTPRARRLVVAEPQSQKSVAVFLAAFIFSVVGLVAMGIGNYGPAGRLVLFASAVGVLSWVVVSFMSYIDVLSRIGQVAHTIAIVERAAWKALREHARQPLGGAQAADGPPEGAQAVQAQETGYVQYVDVQELQQLAEAHSTLVYVVAHAGDLIHPQATLAYVTLDTAAGKGTGSIEALNKAVRKAFVIGPERTIEQDAGYGLIVLAEIAQRALSPAVNDPGTAIAVMSSQTRLLIRTFATQTDHEAATCSRVTATPASLAPLVAIAYEPIARFSLEHFDVIYQLARHMEALVQNVPGDVAREALAVIQRAVERADRAGVDAVDLAQWRGEAEKLERLVGRQAAGAQP